METKLVALQMELTNACRLKCAECPRILMSRPVGVMDLELAKMLVTDALAYQKERGLREMGFNVNGLGEPLLYPHFAELVAHMDAAGAKHMDLFTSLIAPTRMVERAVEALNGTKMHVTLAMTKHLYDNEGKRQFDDETFDRHLEMFRGLSSNVDRHMGAILTKFHTDQDIAEFEAKYGAMFDKDHFHLIKNLNPWFNLVKDMAHPTFGSAGDSMDRHVCDYPFILLHVGWNGDVIICCTDDVDGEGLLGKIEKPGDLAAVWHGPALEEVRRLHNAFTPTNKPCDKCERTAWHRV